MHWDLSYEENSIKKSTIIKYLIWPCQLDPDIDVSYILKYWSVSVVSMYPVVFYHNDQNEDKQNFIAFLSFKQLDT